MYKTLQDFVGNTPLVRLQRIPGAENARRGNVILAKLEGNNPAGSVKDRPALSMIAHAEARGDIRPGDTLIESTSGNTGIALAMAAAIKGYRMILVMPENQSIERRQTMRAFGAELVLTPKGGGMEMARDVADKMRDEGKGIILDQFANPDNPLAHFEGTGPEIWRDTDGKVTHFVSSMGTTGTIMGTSAFLKAQNPAIQIIGCQPDEGSQIPGIRKWPEAYLPKIYDKTNVDRIEYVGQADAEAMTRRLATEEGIFAGISSGGALAIALRLSLQLENAVIVSIICDRGDRYLSNGRFPGMKPVLVFDIETIPDVAGLRRLNDLPAGLSDDEVAELAFQQRRARTGNDFLQLHLQRVVTISCVLRTSEGLKVWSLSEPDLNEGAIIQRFFDGIEKFTPQLVSWNGSGFDLPVLHYRGMLHGVAAPRYWDLGEGDYADSRDFKWNNYISRYHLRHLDLMDLLALYNARANAPLDDLAKLFGFPGKLGMDGGKVWEAWQAGRAAEIRDYCETDVINTYLVYNRFRRMRGELTAEEEVAEGEFVKAQLARIGAPHWQEFLAAWG